MADSETPSAQAPVTFDTWQQAINESIKSPRDYIKFANKHDLSSTVEQLEGSFPVVVSHHLQGLDSESVVARDIKNALEFAHEICPNPWRAAFASWCADPENNALNAIIAKARANPDAFSYHGFIGDLCNAFGTSLSAGPHGLTSDFFSAQSSDAVQYKARLADGSWENIGQADLVTLARKPDGPHIVHSANHAFLDNPKPDLDSLQNEFAKLFDGSRLPVQSGIEAADTGHLSTWDKNNLGPNDTITVFATHTQQNRFLNLAQLFHRLDEVDRNQANPQADTFQHAAPIAIDMVETLLKSIVVDGDVEKIHAHRNAAGKPIFFDEPVTLRPDAIDIIRRQRYRGFSKGGNDFRDAMRLLVHTLDAKDAGQAHLVAMPEGINTRDLISNMSVIVFGLNEKPMADYYREHGVNVPIISSKNDITAPPSVKHEADEPAYNYVGDSTNDGHAPSYSVKGMLADWRIHDLLKMHGAISQGQAAITDINFVPVANGAYAPDTLSLEVAHGTSDAMMDRVLPAFTQALHDAGLANVEVVRVGDSQGRARYQLQGEGLVSAENIEHVQGVLRALSARHKPDKPVDPDKRKVKNPQPEHLGIPLWVSEATAYEKISGMKRYLVLEGKDKLDQQSPYPISVIDPASVVERARYMNEKDLREHPRTLRNTEHPRIATIAPGEQQIG